MTAQAADFIEVTEVPVEVADPHRFLDVLDGEGESAFSQTVQRARQLLAGRRIWNINSTARGGGVAELLTALLPYARGTGIDARWLVIGGDDRFFTVTKRIHNRLHGMAGDGEDLTESDRHHYELVLARQAGEVLDRIGPDDLVILHDPQTAGLAPHIRTTRAAVIWRCHIGTESPNAIARQTWSWLLPYVECADCYVFSRRAYAWSCLDARRTRVVAPSIDPFSDKNRMLDARAVDTILSAAGILRTVPGEAEHVTTDGKAVRVEHTAVMLEFRAD